MNERDELLSGIQAALKGAFSPAAAQVPGVPSDAPQYLKDAAHAALVNKPQHHRTADEVSYMASVADASVFATLSKPVDQIGPEERSELLRQIRECEGRGWQ